MQRIPARFLPVRVGLTLVGVALVVLNVVAPTFGAVPASDEVLLGVFVLIGTAVVGDTVRPSGMVRGGPALERLEELARKARARAAAPRGHAAAPDTKQLDVVE